MKIELPNDHENPTDSQVIIAITGTPIAIADRLATIMDQLLEHPKPIQGTTIAYNAASTIITPVWKGKPF